MNVCRITMEERCKMSILIKGLDIDSHRVIKCFIVPYKDRAQLVIGNKYDEGIPRCHRK